jgi:hypothetical protein
MGISKNAQVYVIIPFSYASVNRILCKSIFSFIGLRGRRGNGEAMTCPEPYNPGWRPRALKIAARAASWRMQSC